MTMFDDAHYRWDHDPADGEYEFQFDRFETTEDYHDQAVFIIVDTENEEDIGDIILPTANVPDLSPDDASGGIYIGTIEDSSIVNMTYDPDRTEQQRQDIKQLYDQVRATSDDESGTDEELTDGS